MKSISKLALFLTLLFVPASMLISQESEARQKILILGDSISMAYGPFVKQQLSEFADVSRPVRNGKDENCAGTIHGVANLDRWLAAAGEVDLIFFNFGLHDLKRVDRDTKNYSNNPADPRQAEPDEYRQQLSQIVARLKQTEARLVFVTTTPVPVGDVKPRREVGDPLHYNAIARTVVDHQGIEVLDLYAPALKNLAEWQQPVNVHFNPKGSEELAKLVSARAREVLARKDASAANPAPWTADNDQVERLSQKGDFLYCEANVPEFELPDVFGAGGKAVGKDQWPAQRKAMIELFESEMYGRPPVQLESATIRFETGPLIASEVDPRISTRTVTAIIGSGQKELFRFPLRIFQPSAEGPFPAIVLIHNREFPDASAAIEIPTGFLPVSMLVEQGYAVAVFYTTGVEPDRADANGEGIRAACDREFGDSPARPDYWGCLTAWAWGASRVADYLVTDRTFSADQLTVIGHSRGGKTALWAAARDERFAVAISNESGCGGAALSRRKYGETVARISTAFPYWFAPKFADYANREQELPFDQHQLIGLIAPRGVCIGSASEDLWADPRGEYLALAHTAPVYKLLGAPSISDLTMPAPGEQVTVGRTSYHLRPGAHDLTEGDWLRYLTFLNQQFKRE